MIDCPSGQDKYILSATDYSLYPSLRNLAVGFFGLVETSGNGPFVSVLDYQKMPAIRTGGFSVVSLLGSSRLWGLLSRLPRFLKVHLTPKYYFRSNKSLHLFETHCAFLPLFNPHIDFLQAVKVTKSGHHLLHDRASKGYGSIPGWTSQTDLHRMTEFFVNMHANQSVTSTQE